jgi:hypothetical protein
LREFEADNCMSKKKISLVCYKHIWKIWGIGSKM